MIGKQGFIIKSLMIKTGTFISLVSPNPMKRPSLLREKKVYVTPNEGMARFRVKGTEEGVELAIAQVFIHPCPRPFVTCA